ncbi:GNAT family N-acetyltransferase [Cyanobium sp. Morenito 9A2]|nr:GNAT family N-acetyltransferase [Cyanobium sp. Morenito 9A2]
MSLKPYRCFSYDNLVAHLLPPDRFIEIANWVGQVRASTYRSISPYGPNEFDLDGRDHHYWHLLVVDEEAWQLAAALRMSFSQWHHVEWSGNCSYLEHCYPGLDRCMAEAGHTYVELGRSFVAAPYQRHSDALLVLFQAMASIPLATGHRHALGMVSYNHFQHSDELHQAFIKALMKAPFYGDFSVPSPRHHWPSHSKEDDDTDQQTWEPNELRALELVLRNRYDDTFRLPLLLRKYWQLANARVVGLSLARDFNQICEILMHSDLSGLRLRQEKILVRQDLKQVW